MKLLTVTLIISVALTLMGLKTQAQNLLQNGSFESGTFTPNTLALDTMKLANGSTAISDWVVGAGVSSNVLWLRTPDNHPENGNFEVGLESSRTSLFSFIEQTFATVPGQQYIVSGFFQNAPDQYGSNQTSVQINGKIIGTATTFAQPTEPPIIPPGETEWTNESFMFTATGTTSTLKFEDSVPAGTFLTDDTLIDNVSVQAVPDFGSTALMFSIALGGLGWFGRLAIDKTTKIGTIA